MNSSFLTRNLKQAALIWSCFFVFGCENDPKTIEDWTKGKAMTEQAINIETYLSQGSRMRAKLWAPFMLRYESDTIYVEFPKSLHVNFFDSAGQVESHLDSKY